MTVVIGAKRSGVAFRVSFPCCAGLFIFYLISTKVFGFYLPELIFWFSLLAMIVLLVRQAVSCRERPWLILLGILVLVTLLRVTYRTAGTLWPLGGDAYNSYFLVREILARGSEGQIAQKFPMSAQFPLAFIYGAESSMMTGIDPYDIVNWMPSMYTSVTVPLFYLLTIELFRSKKVALVASFSFGMLWTFVEYDSVFIKESVAFPMFVGALYAYFRARHSGKRAWLILSIALSASCIVAHHLTSFLLVAFLMLATGIDAAGRLFGIGFGESAKQRPLTNMILPVLLTTILLGYWTFQRVSALRLIVDFLEQTASLSFRSSFLQTHYGVSSGPRLWMLQVAKFSDIVFAIVIGAACIYAISSRRTRRFEAILLVWGVLMGFFAIRTQVGIATPGSLWGDRLLNFGYLMLLPMSVSILANLRSKRLNALRSMLLCTMILYAFIGVFHIPPSLYTISNDPFASDGRRFYFVPQEEKAAFWFNASGSIAVDQQLPPLGGILYQSRYSISGGLNLTVDQTRLAAFRYLFSRAPEPPSLTSRNRIYHNGLVEIHVLSSSHV